MREDALLTIVVTIVDGGDKLRAFLRSLQSFDNPPPLEVLVPYDDSIAETALMAAEFPEMTFIPLGRVDPIRPITTEAGQHELYDRRRSTGLAAARGEVIGMLEDRGYPDPDWARVLMRLYRETGKNVIGGAIECQEPAPVLNFAFWVSEFGRFGRPFDTGPASWVSDVNVSYSRKALEATRHLWKDRFHEPIVNWHLISLGEELLLSNELIVRHTRKGVTLGHLLPERFHWGRLFGNIRQRAMSPLKRLIFIAASPIIPPMLWVRHGIMQTRKGNGLRYLKALPYLMILTTAWTLGEVWGVITRRP